MNLYHKLLDRFARTRVGGWMFLNVFNPIDKRVMRWSNGSISMAVGSEFYQHSVLLTCTGAKSGRTFEVPLLATPNGDQYFLIASRAGHEKNPAWYHNLKANPDCALLVPRRGEIAYVAHEAEGDERDRAWATANEIYSGFTDYQARTKRRIPVMVLTPASQQV